MATILRGNPSETGAFSWGCLVIGHLPPEPRVKEPSDVFLRKAGPDFEPEIRNCLRSDDPRVRQAAARALVEMFRDEEALEVLRGEAREAPGPLRAGVLRFLARIRDVPSADLFPPLLQDENPLLRQIGVLGVGRFRLRSHLPDLLSRVTDLDPTTASLAVAALAEWHPAEALPLLLTLAVRDGPLAEEAGYALLRYRSREDLDALLAALEDPRATEVGKKRLLGVLSSVTLREGPELVGLRISGPAASSPPVSPQTLADWKRWWKKHRLDPPAVRIRASLEELVQTYVRHQEPRWHYAGSILHRRFPGSSCFDATYLSPTCRERTLSWWASIQNLPVWEILTSEPATIRANVDLLDDLDPLQCKREVFAAFDAMWRRYPPQSWPAWDSGTPSLHDLLVERAGVDFGDPAMSKGEPRERILEQWRAWARREGIWP